MKTAEEWATDERTQHVRYSNSHLRMIVLIKDIQLDVIRHLRYHFQNPEQLRLVLIELMGWKERGGGPEGIYYTHPKIDGKKMFSDFPHYEEVL